MGLVPLQLHNLYSDMITGGLREELAKLTAEEMREVASELVERARQSEEGEVPRLSGKVDWNHYRGILKHGPDPLEYQRAIQAEWDGRP